MSDGAFKNPFDVIDEDLESEVVDEVPIPAEVEQALRKLSKKGSTTRMKGFAELMSVLKGFDDVELVRLCESKAFVGVFTKIFKKYLQSSERSSRASVAELTALLLAKADRKGFLQPILKEILPIWLLGLFDPISEIGASLLASLGSVFPAGGKLKVLLERFDEVIWKEISEYAVNPSKFQVLREVTVSELDGTADDAAEVVELVKIEILGLIDLCSWYRSRSGSELKPLLFLRDTEIGASRRSAMYKLAAKVKDEWFTKVIQSLLLKETSPSALPAVMDLLERSDNYEFLGLLGKDSFILSVLSNLPVKEFPRFARLLEASLVSDDSSAVVDCFVGVCTGNTFMNKDRFLLFFRDLAVPVFRAFVEKSVLLTRLLFGGVASKRGSTANGLVCFSPLSASESMECLATAFSADEIMSVCRGRPGNLQAAYAVSFLISKRSVESDDLAELLEGLSLGDLQNRELLSVIPKSLLVERFDGESFSASELLRLIQVLPRAQAIQVLKRQDVAWDRILKCSFLAKSTVLDVLFECDSFLGFCRSELDNAMLVECAFCTEIKVYEELPPLAVLEEAFSNAKAFKLTSPLLIEALQVHELVSHPRITGLSHSDKRILFENLDLSGDPELFIALNCAFEEFYPIRHFQEALESLSLPSSDHLDILMFKSPYESRIGDSMLGLLSFPLERIENQRVVSVAAVVFGAENLVSFRVKEEDFGKMVSCNDFELYCMSKFVDFSTVELCSCFDSFKGILKFHSSGLEPLSVNSCLGETIFNEVFDEGKLVLLAECVCFDPVLPVRSDNLSGIFSGLSSVSPSHDLLLMLVASVHVGQEDLKKEFWQVQFRETFSKLITWRGDEDSLMAKEVKTRLAAGIWGRLADPEVDLLQVCNFSVPLQNYKRELELVTGNPPLWDSTGLSSLIVVAAPFTENLFTVAGICSYFERNCEATSTDLAMRAVYLQLHMDEALVASSVALQQADQLDDGLGPLIFPFYRFFEVDEQMSLGRFAVLFEMFISAAEGSREDLRLLGAFGEVLRVRLFSLLYGIIGARTGVLRSREVFDFSPGRFDGLGLVEHCLHRLCGIFPLLVGEHIPGALDICGKSCDLFFKREMERVRRQPVMTFESVEICLKPVITSTTRIVNLRVTFAGEIDLSVDLHIPRAFPLTFVRVEGKSRSGLAESKWKSALLTLQTLLRSSTFPGNLVEVFRGWQANALKLFQGLEECAVCYCVLHPSDKSLPGPACKQCKHKFHATCLYKWFKSSGNATCPLCRALF